MAKDVNISKLPEIIKENNIPIPNKQLPNRFGSFLDPKIKDILNDVLINNEVYNGKLKVVNHNLNFMNKESVRESINSTKPKNTKAYNGIPS
jgi:hypothetical protein